MTDGVRAWLVEREYAADRDLVRLTYATTDGERYLVKEQSVHLARDGPTAAIAVDDDDRLSDVPDAEMAEGYRTEALRMAEEYDPDDVV